MDTSLRYRCRGSASDRPGGYHAVHIGDKFCGGRYQIINKLGFGGQATVWLARDLEFDQCVALKILVAEAGHTSREARMLRMLSSRMSSSPGSQHIIRLLNSFVHRGLNGSHQCLALELLGPSIQDAVADEFNGNGVPSQTARSVMMQVMWGLGFLHENGVGHGDLHTGNVAFADPRLDSLPASEIVRSFGEPTTDSVVRTDGQPIGNEVLQYLVEPRILSLSRNRWDSVKIVDFAESFTEVDKPVALQTPLVLRPPELILSDNWDYRVDLWSAGCLMFALVAKQPPFDSIMITKPSLVSQMRESIDLDSDEPKTLQEWLEEIYFDEERTPPTPQLSREGIKNFGSMVRRLLVFESASRASATEILRDEWFLGTP